MTAASLPPPRLLSSPPPLSGKQTPLSLARGSWPPSKKWTGGCEWLEAQPGTEPAQRPGLSRWEGRGQRRALHAGKGVREACSRHPGRGLRSPSAKWEQSLVSCTFWGGGGHGETVKALWVGTPGGGAGGQGRCPRWWSDPGAAFQEEVGPRWGTRLDQGNSWTDGRTVRHQAGLLSPGIPALTIEPCMSHSTSFPSVPPNAKSFPKTKCHHQSGSELRPSPPVSLETESLCGCHVLEGPWKFRMEPGQPGDTHAPTC